MSLKFNQINKFRKKKATDRGGGQGVKRVMGVGIDYIDYRDTSC